MVVPVLADQTLYDALRAGGRPIASACTGDAVCGRCTVRVFSGKISALDENEANVLKNQGVEPGMRLACMVRAQSDLVVGTDYW